MFHLQNRLKAQKTNRVLQSLPKVSVEPPSNTVVSVAPVQPRIRESQVTKPRIPKSKDTVLPSPKRIKIQVLCYDGHTEQQAKDRFAKFSWAHIVRVKPEWQHSGLYENCMYLQYLPENIDDWYSQDFVGTISYKAPQKIDLTSLINCMETGNLKGQSLDAWDIVFFYCSRFHFESSVKSHPNFMKIWNDTIVKKCEIQSKEVAFCNFWMARPACMLHQVTYFQKILWPVVSSHPLSMTDARYRSTHSKESVLQCNGKPYQTHVPFVLERVPRNFFKQFGYLYTCL